VQHVHKTTARFLLLGVALIAAFGLVRGQAADEPILGTYPTGNVTLEFTIYPTPDISTQIIIDHVGAGLRLEGNGIETLVHTAPEEGTRTPRTHVFDMQQDFDLFLDAARGRDIRVTGSSQARLTSVATGIEFDWEARATGEAACVEGDGSPAGCFVYEVDQVLSGNISGPDGRGTCGSLWQEITYIIVLDQDLEAEHAYVFGGFTNTPHGTGELRVSSEQCAASIYGVMPGDNIKLNSTARVSLDGTITEIGSQSLVAVVIIVGVMRDGTEFTGEGVANLRLRDGTAFGDIEGELFLAGSEAPLQFEGSLRLENVEIGKGTFTADGVLRFMPSETDGTGND
jgi:hypothetical protein